MEANPNPIQDAGSQISVESAQAGVEKFLQVYCEEGNFPIQGFTLSKDALQHLINQEGAEGVNFYLTADTETGEHVYVVAVPADENYDTIGEENRFHIGHLYPRPFRPDQKPYGGAGGMGNPHP